MLAAVHLTTRTPEKEGEILVNGESVVFADLQLEQINGSIVNGKGEETQIDAKGIPLSEVCGVDFETATVTASDEYSVTVAASEAENAYLISCDDGTVQLIVFGDENAKRDVKNVVRIDSE